MGLQLSDAVEVVGRHRWAPVARWGCCLPSCAATGKALGFRSLPRTQLIELQRVWLKLGVFPAGRKHRGFKPCLCPDLGEKYSTFWNLIAKWKFPSFLLLQPQEIRSKLIGLCKQSAFILGKYFHHSSIHP